MTFAAENRFDQLTPSGWDAYHWGMLTTTGGIMQMKFPTGTIAPDASFTPGNVWRVQTANKTVYMRVSLKLSDNFKGNPSGAQKLFEWFLGGGGRVLLSLYGPDASELKLDAFGRDDARFSMNRGNPTFTRGQWHTLEAIATLNSGPGVPDGVFAYYLDGQLVSYHTSVVWIKSGEGMHGWLEFKIDPVWGGLGGQIRQEQFIWMDNVYLSGR